MDFISRFDPMCIADWMSFVGSGDAQGRARPLIEKMRKQWPAGCRTYPRCGEAVRRARNNERRQFNGAEQLQFQFVNDPTKRSRGALLRTYQAMWLG